MTSTSADQFVPLQLGIPMPRGFFVFIRVVIASSIFCLFIGFFCKAAISDLIDFRHTRMLPIIASVIWLALVLLVLGTLVRDVGLRQFIVDVLAIFSQHHFVSLTQQDGTFQIGFAFRLLGCTVYRLIIDSSGLEKITWNTGQASSFAGRDMDDWHVAVWFRKDCIRRGRLPEYSRTDPVALHLLGDSGPKAKVELFGYDLLNFLREAGLEFEPTESGTKFLVRK